jgi:hypothetical protein
MVKYRNAKTGRVLERPTEDEWLEASAGWTRESEPEAEQPAEDKQEGSND